MAEIPDLVQAVINDTIRLLEQISTERDRLLAETQERHAMFAVLLEHEARRTARKLGPEHARSLQLSELLQGARAHVKAVAVQREKFSVTVPDAAEDAALVHGRVVDQDGLGISGLRVTFVSRAGQPLPGALEATTGSTGYYTLAVAGALLEKLLATSEGGILLGVFTARGRLVHRSPDPLVLARGLRHLQEVRLDRARLMARRSPESPPPGAETARVPDLAGKPEAEAGEILAAAGLKPGRRTEKQAPGQAGRVLEQRPSPGSEVAPGSPVDLVIGAAARMEMPRLLGARLATARKRVLESGLTVGTVTEQDSESAGLVLAQEPEPGEEVLPGTTVNLVVGRKRVRPLGS